MKNSNSILAIAILCLATSLSSAAQTFFTLDTFDGTNGSEPLASLVQAFDGNLYGTTYAGGAENAGYVFRLSPTGTLTPIYSFCLSGIPCADGADPQSGLTLGSDGNLYGATYFGGNYTTCGIQGGCGTIFKITTDGVLTTLHQFLQRDGAEAFVAPIQASDGNFYGITTAGGENGIGVIYKISPSGHYQVISQMSIGTSYSGLVQAADGNLYGSTWDGGDTTKGTTFRVNRSGTYTTLYQMCLGGDCATNPLGMIQGNDGYLYGITKLGGNGGCPTNDVPFGCGTVFKMNYQNGDLTVLHIFDQTDGGDPIGTLVQAPNGQFYGVTQAGGANNSCTNGCGTIFSMTPTGAVTTLYSFCSLTDCDDGEMPVSSLLQATNGKFYGTSQYGGADGDGIVYMLNTHLPAFVETNPSAGVVGSTVTILGTNLAGATSVTFNGVSATFSVISNSEITATVPAGALTGPVSVTTPATTLTSNVKFQVLP